MRVKLKVYTSDGLWFDKDSICIKLQPITESTGLYYGTRTSQTEAEAKVQVPGYEPCWPLGKKYQRSELSDDNEFKERNEFILDLEPCND